MPQSRDLTEAVGGLGPYHPRGSGAARPEISGGVLHVAEWGARKQPYLGRKVRLFCCWARFTRREGSRPGFG